MKICSARESLAVCAIGAFAWVAFAGGSDQPTASRVFALVESGSPVCAIVATGNKTVDADIAFFTNTVARMSGAELAVVPSCSGRAESATSFLQLQLSTTANRIVFDIRETDLLHEDDYEITFPDAETMRIVGTETISRATANARPAGS